MAPIAPNTTARMFFDYVTGSDPNSQEHTVAVRVAAPATTADAFAGFEALLTAMGTARFWTGWRILRARYQAAGSDFSVPVVLPPALAGFVGSGGAGSRSSEAIEVTLQGRSFSTGRRVDLSLYGVAGFALDTNFRILPTEAGGGWINAAIAALGGAYPAFAVVDGSQATWYPYANWNYNSYWERELRN